MIIVYGLNLICTLCVIRGMWKHTQLYIILYHGVNSTFCPVLVMVVLSCHLNTICTEVLQHFNESYNENLHKVMTLTLGFKNTSYHDYVNIGPMLYQYLHVLNNSTHYCMNLQILYKFQYLSKCLLAWFWLKVWTMVLAESLHYLVYWLLLLYLFGACMLKLGHTSLCVILWSCIMTNNVWYHTLMDSMYPYWPVL